MAFVVVFDRGRSGVTVISKGGAYCFGAVKIRNSRSLVLITSRDNAAKSQPQLLFMR